MTTCQMLKTEKPYAHCILVNFAGLSHKLRFSPALQHRRVMNPE